MRSTRFSFLREDAEPAALSFCAMASRSPRSKPERRRHPAGASRSTNAGIIGSMTFRWIFAAMRSNPVSPTLSMSPRRTRHRSRHVQPDVLACIGERPLVRVNSDGAGRAELDGGNRQNTRPCADIQHAHFRPYFLLKKAEHQARRFVVPCANDIFGSMVRTMSPGSG